MMTLDIMDPYANLPMQETIQITKKIPKKRGEISVQK